VNVKLRLTMLFSASLAVVCAMLGLVFTSAAGADSGSTSPVVPLNTSCVVTTLITLAPTGDAVVSSSLTEPCAFASGSTTTETYSGSPIESKTAPSDGLITLNAAAKDDPLLSIDGGSFLPAIFGVNTVVATGVNPAGGTNTATFLIDIVQGSLSNANSGSSSSGGGSGTLTGTNTGKSTGTVGLAFTGANLAALIAAALFMLLLGASVVIYARRKAMAQQLEYAVSHPDQQRPLAISDMPDTNWEMKNIW
jgi:hypothetical protein